MADNYKGEEGRYCCSGYAASGYASDRKRSDRYLCSRYGTSDSFLCGTNRKRKYTAEAKRRNCGGEAKRRKFRKTQNSETTGISDAMQSMERGGGEFQAGGTETRYCTRYISPVGEGNK